MGDALDRVFGLLDLLALAAVVVAGLGIVNTLSMDTWERSRELGVLRAAGHEPAPGLAERASSRPGSSA